MPGKMVEGMDVCDECYEQILRSATCRVCGYSIPYEDARVAYEDAGQTHQVSLECAGCHPREDGEIYWIIEK